MSFIVIEGNVTAEATLREFASKRTGEQIPISNATVAVNDRRYDTAAEQWADTGTTFYEVTVTGGEAVHFAASAPGSSRPGTCTSRSTATPTATSAPAGGSAPPTTACRPGSPPWPPNS